jgi:hypothetical protein
MKAAASASEPDCHRGEQSFGCCRVQMRDADRVGQDANEAVDHGIASSKALQRGFEGCGNFSDRGQAMACRGFPDMFQTHQELQRISIISGKAQRLYQFAKFCANEQHLIIVILHAGCPRLLHGSDAPLWLPIG